MAQTNTHGILVTTAGLKKIQEELNDLKTVSRKEVAKRLAEAISYGDLSENAEYDEAKNQQAFVEGRIAELEEQIKYAEIIDDKKGSVAGLVQIGSTVELQRADDKESHKYMIVGSTEADPIAHRISNVSPVGRAILGKKKKDTVMVKAPGGEFEYKILSVA
jgi:transcription elongation factor GreA